MGIEDFHRRVYKCDYPGCTKCGDTQKDSFCDSKFVCMVIDTQEFEQGMSLKRIAVFCEAHASKVREVLGTFGFSKRLR